MPVINIYLPQELFELVKKDKSKIIQLALKMYAESQAKVEESVARDRSDTYVG
jgi:hypothetical protein